MPQKPGAPPEEWERRKGDAAAQRSAQILLEGLESVRTELAEDRKTRAQQTRDQVEGSMKAYVTWVALVALLTGFLALNWGMTDKRIAPAETRADQAITKAISTESTVRDLASNNAIQLIRIEAKVDALVRVSPIQNEKPSVAKEELERRTGEKRTPRKER